MLCRLYEFILSRNGYNVTICQQSKEALETAKRVSPQLILLDLMMPEVDGFEVCRRLKADRETKDIPVIVVTVSATRESVIKAIRQGACDYLIKTDFRIPVLLSRIERALSKRVPISEVPVPKPSVPERETIHIYSAHPGAKLLTDAQIAFRLKKATELRALPFVVKNVMDATLSMGTSVQDIADIISRDQALTAKVLRIANSSFYAFRSKILTLQHAVSNLGILGIRELVTGVSLLDKFFKPSVAGFDRRLFWEHSLGCGVLARILAAESGYPEPDNAFVSGLLHDLGKAIFDDFFSREYPQVLRHTKEEGCYLRHAESELLGLDHVEVARRLIDTWRLPEILRYSIVYHHEPWDRIKGLGPYVDIRIIGVTQISNTFIKAIQIGSSGDDLLEELPREIFRDTGVRREHILNNIINTKVKVQELEQLMLLGVYEGPIEELSASKPYPEVTKRVLWVEEQGDRINPCEVLLRTSGYDLLLSPEIPIVPLEPIPDAIVIRTDDQHFLEQNGARLKRWAKDLPGVALVLSHLYPVLSPACSRLGLRCLKVPTSASLLLRSISKT
jgi:HD-like signal output (HDOD) protein/CheY-like chemotaxis protein